jgi:HEAT repeat protein
MQSFRPFRAIVVGVLLTTSGVTIVGTAWLLWPRYRDYRLAEQLRAMSTDYNSLEFNRKIERLVEQDQGGRYVIAMLSDGTKDPDVGIRRRSTSALGKYAVVRHQIYPRLMESLGDEQKYVRMEVWRHLEKIPSVAIPFIVEALSSPNARVRAGSLEALGSIRGIEAADTLPRIRRLLTDDDARVREYALWAIASIAPRHPDTAELMVQAINDPSAAVRSEAVSALGRFELIDPTPLIRAVLSDDPEISKSASYVVDLQIGAGHIPGHILPALVGALHDPRQNVRINVICALGRTGQNGMVAVPALRELLQDDDPKVRFPAARSIWQITGEFREALPTIIETHPELAVPALVEALDDRHYESCLDAIFALAAFGSDSRPALPALRRIMTHSLLGHAARCAIEAIEATNVTATAVPEP